MMPAVSVTALRSRLTPPRRPRRDGDAATPCRGRGRRSSSPASAWPRCRCSARPRRPTTRGRGSSGAARSATSTSTRVSGPSWKPLPVLFTTVFAFFGDAAAPDLWLLVARAGGLLAIAMAYRLGSRLGGRPAGVIAALALLLADDYVRSFWRGNSEGLLVALCLWAVERHLDGRRTDAFLLGLGAALLRPEVWPFFGLYGLWLAWVEPRRRVLVARRLRGHRRALVRARVLGLGRLAARRQPRAPAQPGLAGVRRPPVLRGVRALVGDPLRARPARRARRARQAGARAALGRAARARRGRRRADDRGGADDRGRLRRQPALRRAARRARVRARGRRLGRARARGARALRPRGPRRCWRSCSRPRRRRS